jgi:N-acetylglutamate synthase-like GNAT family acetyltransferase
MQSIRIEKIVSEEILPKCATILVMAYNSEPWNDEWTQEIALRKLQCFYHSPDFMGLLAFMDEQLVGACVGNIEPYYTGDYFYLKEMFVLPGSQHSGIGKAMMQYLKNELTKLGIRQMMLFTSGDFFPFHFYEKSGFKTLENMVMMHYEHTDQVIK